MGEQRQTGVVQKLIPEKGFGFIRVDGTTNDIFFHRSALGYGEYDALTEGASRLSFVIVPGRDSREGKKRGPRAESIELL